MASPPNLQNEPTMEEILASIRKIISEDQNDAAKAAAQAPAEEETPDDSPVLELDREVRDDGSIKRVVPEPPAPAPVAMATPVQAPQACSNGNEMSYQRETANMDVVELGHEDIISDAARNAVGRSFASLDTTQPATRQEAPTQAGGNLDAAFERAVQSAFEPAIHGWINQHNGEVMEQLKPLIRQWMDDNLPALIENAVRNEIARAVRNRGR